MANETQLRLTKTVEFVLKDKGLLDLKTKLDQTERQLAQVNARMEGGRLASQGFGLAIKGLLGPLTGLFAFSQVARFVWDAAEAQREMAKRTEVLRGQLRQMGVDAAPALDRIKDFTDQLAEMTGVVDDESIPAIQSFIGLTQDVEAALAATKFAALAAAEGLTKDFGEAVSIVENLIAGKLEPAARALGVNLKATPIGAEALWRLLAERINAGADAAVAAEAATSKLAASWDRFGDSVAKGAMPALEVLKSILAGVLDLVTSAGTGVAQFMERVVLAVTQLPARVAAGFRGDIDELKRLDAVVKFHMDTWSREEDERERKTREGKKLSAEQIDAGAKVMAARDKARKDELAKADAERLAKHVEEQQKAALKTKAFWIEQDAAMRKEVKKNSEAMVRENERALIEEIDRATSARFQAYIATAEAANELEEFARQDEIDGINAVLAATRDGLMMRLSDFQEYLARKEELEIEQINKEADDKLAVLDKNDKQREVVEVKRDAKIRRAQMDRLAWEKANARERIDIATSEAAAAFGALATTFPKVKAFAYAEAIMHAANSINSIWAHWGWMPPVAAALIAVSVAATGAQIAKIKAAKFRSGGVVTGRTFGEIGEDGTETILPLTAGRATRAMAAAFAPAMVEASRALAGEGRSGGVAPPTINISTTINSPAFDRATLRDFNRQMERIAREELARRVA